MPVSAPTLEQVQELMTLAGIAYGKPSEIPSYLAAGSLAGGGWTLVWIAKAEDVPVNFAFIAHSTTTGAYAIVIRGTYPDPFSPAYWDDSSQDNPLGQMHLWPGGEVTYAKVSHGTWEAFQGIRDLSDGTTRFSDAACAIPAGATVYFTGHSLGGTLAPVIALWLTGEIPSIDPYVVAFAGMTPGNSAFAALFTGGSKLAGRVWRYNNSLDTVPYGWDRVSATAGFYRPKPRGGLLVWLFIWLLALRLRSYGYTSIGQEVILPGTLAPPVVKFALVAYVLENLYQHLPGTYLDLLGAPPLPFTLSYGAVVAPRGFMPAGLSRLRHHTTWI